MVEDGVRAVLTAAGWLKVRPGSLVVDGAVVLGQAMPVLRFVDDASSIEVTVPRAQVVALDGDLQYVPTAEEQRAAAWAADEARRRSDIAAGRRELRIDQTTVTLRSVAELTVGEKDQARALAEQWQAQGAGADIFIIGGWRGRLHRDDVLRAFPAFVAGLPRLLGSTPTP
jgi:hypothetical protein